MNSQEIIRYISESKKKTPVKLYVKERRKVDYGEAKVFGAADRVVFGDWEELRPILEREADAIEDIVVESTCRNSAVPLMDISNIHARIEPGAIIREHAQIGEKAVIMMGAIINIGAVVGEGTMIDMGAVLGGRATVGAHCHIGAGAVLAGVIEPASAIPVTVGDNVLIGANAVVLEGVSIGSGSVIAAGAVVLNDVPENCVAAGIPAKVIKRRDSSTNAKTELVDALRRL